MKFSDEGDEGDAGFGVWGMGNGNGKGGREMATRYSPPKKNSDDRIDFVEEGKAGRTGTLVSGIS